jgi:hypothetical protein
METPKCYLPICFFGMIQPKSLSFPRFEGKALIAVAVLIVPIYPFGQLSRTKMPRHTSAGASRFVALDDETP